MDYGLGGMRMDRSEEKELSRMVNKMDYGLNGMKTDRRILKIYGRMGN